MTEPLITGTWIDVVHLCPRDGVYWNRKTLAYTEAEWHTLVCHLKRDLGIELIMLQNVAKDGGSVYPSKVETWHLTAQSVCPELGVPGTELLYQA